MGDPVLDYIKKEGEKGFSKKEIRKALEKAGFDKGRLDSIFSDISEKENIDDITDKTDSGGDNYENPEGDVKDAPYSTTKEGSEEDRTGMDKSQPNTGSSHKKTGYFFLIAAMIVIIVFFALIYIYIGDIDTPPAEGGNESLTLGTDDNIYAEPGEGSEETFLVDDTNYGPIPLEGAGCAYDMQVRSRTCRAIFKMDPTLCAGIGQDNDKRDCNEYYIIISAILSGDAGPCKGIEDPQKKILCEASTKNDPNTCNVAEMSEEEKVSCIAMVEQLNSLVAGDPSFCELVLGDERAADLCRTVAANHELIGKSIEPCREYYDLRCP